MESLVKTNKKNKWVGLVILITSLLLCLLVIWIIKNNKVPSPKEMELGNHLIKVEKDNKYGYINSDGELVLDYIYDMAEDFYYKYGIVKKDEAYYLIDEKGNTKFEGNNISYVKDIGEYLIDGTLYDYKLNKVSNYTNLSYLLEGFYLFNQDNVSGIINYKGKLIYKEDSNNIEILVKEKDSYLNGLYAVIKKNNKYGIINLYNGMIIVEYQDKEIVPLGNNFFKMNNEYLYLDENRVAARSKNEISFYNIKEEILNVNNKKYLLSTAEYRDNIDIPNITSTTKFENKTGIEKFLSVDGVGLIQNKKVLVSPIYKDITFIDYDIFKYVYKETGNKIVLLLLNDKTYLYSYNNKKILYIFDTDKIEIDNNTSFVKYTDSNGNHFVYNLLSNKYGYYKEDSIFFSNYMLDNGKIYNIELDKIYG